MKTKSTISKKQGLFDLEEAFLDNHDMIADPRKGSGFNAGSSLQDFMSSSNNSIFFSTAAVNKAALNKAAWNGGAEVQPQQDEFFFDGPSQNGLSLNIRFVSVIQTIYQLLTGPAQNALSSAASQTSTTAAKQTSTTPAWMSKITDSGIANDVKKFLVNGGLSYQSVLTILQDAAVGGVNTKEFQSLQALASVFNTSGGVTVSSYVQQITNDVVFGNSANARWTGGAAQSVALGNLSGSSTELQAQRLVGKWFLGTDLPSTNLSALGSKNYNPVYKASMLPLYGKSGSPSYLDVNQGYVGDCYFMSSIAEVALKNPNSIKSMITDNGNGTYGVRFFINGQADYVTVNTQLPTFPSGLNWANGSSLEFANGDVAWPALLEKAYAQLNEQTNVQHGACLNQATNSYAGVSGGYASALTEITGQSVSGFRLAPTTSAQTLASDLQQLSAAWNANQELLVATSSTASGNLVAGHMYEVVGLDSAKGVLTLHNPWGSAYGGSMAMTFTESLSHLASVNASVYMTSGKPLA